MDNQSWIKLFRKFKEWGWYKDTNTKSVWLEILLTANFEDREWMGILVKRGQLITSVKHLSENLDISIQSIRTSLDRLKSTNEITIKTTPHYTLITINKYNEYQEVTNKSTNDQQTTNKQLTTTKEYKNKRNILNTAKKTKQIPIPIVLPNGKDDNFEELLKPKAVVTTDWQYLALDIIEKLNVPAEKKSAFFKACRDNQTACEAGLRYAIDFPNPKIRWNMFFVKYNEFKNKKNDVQKV